MIAQIFQLERWQIIMSRKITLILPLAILVLQTNFVESQVVRDGLVSYWTFDTADVAGDTVKDAVGGNSRILWKIIGTHVSVTIEDAKNAGIHFRSDGEVTDGKWHHVLFTCDRSDATRLYIDGKLDGEGGKSKDTDVNTESRMYIGASVRIGEATRRYFEGLIDEVGIYDRVLTEDEVERNYNAKGLAVNPQNKLAITWGELKVF